MSAAIEIAGLTKVFGEHRALDGVDLTVPEGSIFGFLGPNGAGKTTTLRIVTGLARATSGYVSVLGADATAAGDAVRRQIGYLPDVPGFYEWMTAEEFLRFAGGLFGLSGTELDERVRVLLDMAGLAGVRTRVGGYSRGMRQRLGVAQALVNAPKLLLLDEPTSALDPIGRRELLEMLASLRGRTTVFFSTHILADVERVCDTVAILRAGKVAAQAPIGELKARYGASKVIVEVTGEAAGFAERLRARPWASAVDVGDDGSIEVKVTDEDAVRRELPAMVTEAGVGLVRFESGELSLEEVFVELVAGDAR